MNTPLAGALAGFLATAPMSATMLLLRQAVPAPRRPSLPPPEVTARIAEEAGVRDDLDEPGLRVATVLAHFAYGAAAGALYAPLADRLPLPPVAKGIGFGLGVWTGSYLGWIPALGLLPPATEQPAPRNAVMIAAHVVWGATTGLLVERLVPNRDGRAP